MKELMTGLTATSGTAAAPHKQENRRHFVLEGDVKKVFDACCVKQVRKNGFFLEDVREMKSRAQESFLEATYDPAAVRNLDHYAKHAAAIAVLSAAIGVADERTARNAQVSLDETVGDEGDATRGDFVTSDQTFEAVAFTKEAPKEVCCSWLDPDDVPVKRKEKVFRSWGECLRQHDNYMDIKEAVDRMPSPDKEICRAILSAPNGSFKTLLAQAAEHCKVSPSRLSRTVKPRLMKALAPFKDILTGGAKFQAARLSKQKCDLL